MEDYQQQQQKLQLAKAVIKEAAAVMMEAPEALAVRSQKLQNMLRQAADIVDVNDDPMDEAEDEPDSVELAVDGSALGKARPPQVRASASPQKRPA